MINRYYDHEYIKLIRMLEKENLAPIFPQHITFSYLWKFINWLLYKLINVTSTKNTPTIKLFINYIVKTMNYQNTLYRLGNLWCIFVLPLDKCALYISDKDNLKQIICAWRLEIGK